MDSILDLNYEAAGLDALCAEALKEAREPGAAGRIVALFTNAVTPRASMPLAISN